MKHIKLVAFLLILSMIICTFSACKEEKEASSSSETEATSGEVSSSKTESQEESSDTSIEASREESDDMSADDTSTDDTSTDDTSKDDTSADDTSKDDTSKDDTSKDDTSKDDPKDDEDDVEKSPYEVTYIEWYEAQKEQNFTNVTVTINQGNSIYKVDGVNSSDSFFRPQDGGRETHYTYIEDGENHTFVELTDVIEPGNVYFKQTAQQGFIPAERAAEQITEYYARSIGSFGGYTYIEESRVYVGQNEWYLQKISYYESDITSIRTEVYFENGKIIKIRHYATYSDNSEALYETIEFTDYGTTVLEIPEEGKNALPAVG